MLSPNALLVEQAALVEGLFAIVPSSSTPDYVCLKNYQKFTALVRVKNTTVVTGSAITLKQATAVAGTSEKALAFSVVYQNIDTGAAQPYASTAVSSNTFTTDNTNSKNLAYVIEVDAAELDINNGFDCIRVGAGNSVNATVDIVYILWGARYKKAILPSPIID